MTASSASPLERIPSAALDSDIELVARVLSGESELYAILMRRHNQRLYRMARAIAGQDDEAEDIVQHTYVAAFQGLSAFRAESSFATWLTRIAVNEALGRIRKRARRGIVELVDEGADRGVMGTFQDPEAGAYRREMAKVLEEQIDDLPENLRVAFVMRDVEELTTREAASVLGISEAALRVRVHRARHLLQERLSGIMGRAPEAFQFAGSRCDRTVLGVLRRLGVI